MLAIAAALFAFVPSLLVVRNLMLFRTPTKANQRIPISVIIPARNEAANIEAVCSGVLANQDVALDLIVVDDHSTDATASVLAGIHDPRLTVIQTPQLPPGWTGKQYACATGARAARFDLMLFLDADVRLAPDALSRIGGFMHERSIGLGSGFPKEVCSGFGDGLLLPLIHFVLLGFLPMAMMRRSLSPAFGAGCGQMIAVWRDAYQTVGGHETIRRSMHDGITLPRAFRAAGIMTDIFDASGFASCRMYTDTRTLIEGLLKNATEGMAKPIALPIWTIILTFGQVLPLPLALFSPSALALFALAVSLASRIALAMRFRTPWWSALLHPLAVAVFLMLQWFALLKQRRGRPATWRGRIYAP